MPAALAQRRHTRPPNPAAASWPSGGSPAFAPDLALFLDIDGTVLDLAERPDSVVIQPAVVDLLVRLERILEGALALVSGRALADVDRLFAPRHFCGAGQHGAERRDGHGRMHRASAPGLEQATALLAPVVGLHPGLILESKGASVALHCRAAPQLSGLAEAEARRVLALLGDRFELQPGKMVFEIKPRGYDKGSAIADFLRETPFRGRRPIFVGDDQTDESGFALVNSLGGDSVKVGDGATQAHWRVADVAAVRGWLATWIAGGENKQE